MSKHWDYEDDHDWDDDYDYATNGYVYWYGKYYPKEDIDALFKDNSETIDVSSDDKAVDIRFLLFVLAGIGTARYGVYKKLFPTIKKKIHKTEDSRK